MARRDAVGKTAFLVMSVLLLGFGCAARAEAQGAAPRSKTPARAAKASAPLGPLDTVTNAFRFTTEPGEPADFVKKSRPPEDRTTYVPVGGRRAEPTGTVLKPDQVRALEGNLLSTRARHDRMAHRKADPARYRSAAGEPLVPVAKKPPVKCLLTCTVTLKAPPRAELNP